MFKFQNGDPFWSIVTSPFRNRKWTLTLRVKTKNVYAGK